MSKPTTATILSAAARVSGDLETDEDVILAGTFEGTLRTTRSLQILATGSLHGEAHAESVLVSGRVYGPIEAVDRIQIQSGATVEGDISAQRVRVHEDAVFNGRCSIAGPQATRRQYLVPAVLQTFGSQPSPAALDAVQSATEALLRDFGFELEVRAERHGGQVQALRPIFRSREPLAYARLRDQFRSIEQVLHRASRSSDSPEGSSRDVVTMDGQPLQATGANGAQALITALAQLRNGALMLGPVILTRLEDERGARVTVRVRQDSLPAGAPADAEAPDPSALLLSFQRAQSEVAQDLSSSVTGRA